MIVPIQMPSVPAELPSHRNDLSEESDSSFEEIIDQASESPLDSARQRSTGADVETGERPDDNNSEDSTAEVQDEAVVVKETEERPEKEIEGQEEPADQLVSSIEKILSAVAGVAELFEEVSGQLTELGDQLKKMLGGARDKGQIGEVLNRMLKAAGGTLPGIDGIALGKAAAELSGDKAGMKQLLAGLETLLDKKAEFLSKFTAEQGLQKTDLKFKGVENVKFETNSSGGSITDRLTARSVTGVDSFMKQFQGESFRRTVR